MPRGREAALDDDRESGVVPVDGLNGEVLRACRDIVNAAGVVVVNVDFVAMRAEGEQKAALADAQEAIDRIVALAKALRAWAERSEPGGRS